MFIESNEETDKSRLWGKLQNNWLRLFRNANVPKDPPAKKIAGKHSTLKETKTCHEVLVFDWTPHQNKTD